MTRPSPAAVLGRTAGAGDSAEIACGDPARRSTGVLTGRGSLKGVVGGLTGLFTRLPEAPEAARALRPYLATSIPLAVRSPIRIMSRRLSWAAISSRRFLAASSIAFRRAFDGYGCGVLRGFISRTFPRADG